MTEERYTDPLDRAQALVENLTNHAIETNRLRPDQEFADDEGDVECVECGAVIGQERRKSTGSLFCVDCKTYLERLDKNRKFRWEF